MPLSADAMVHITQWARDSRARPLSAACALHCPRVALALLAAGSPPGKLTFCTAAMHGLGDVLECLGPERRTWRYTSFYVVGADGTLSTRGCAEQACAAAAGERRRWRGLRRAWLTLVLGER